MSIRPYHEWCQGMWKQSDLADWRFEEVYRHDFKGVIYRLVFSFPSLEPTRVFAFSIHKEDVSNLIGTYKNISSAQIVISATGNPYQMVLPGTHLNNGPTIRIDPGHCVQLRKHCAKKMVEQGFLEYLFKHHHGLPEEWDQYQIHISSSEVDEQTALNEVRVAMIKALVERAARL